MTKIVTDATTSPSSARSTRASRRRRSRSRTAAGLLQCSPANTNPDLTKGDPAKQLRTKPNNYIRVVTTDDVQGPAASQYIYRRAQEEVRLHHRRHRDLREGRRRCVRGGLRQGRGGTVVKHDAAPKTTQDYVSIMTAAKALKPEAIYFGGVTATGGARILLAAAQAGLGDVPYVGPDGINDGSGATKDSFLNLAGRGRQELLQHPRRCRDLRRQGPVRHGLQGRVRHRRHRLRRPGLSPAPRSSSTRSVAPARPTRPT